MPNTPQTGVGFGRTPDKNVHTFTVSTDGDLTDNQVVTFASTAGETKAATAVTDKIIGVTLQDATQGNEVSVAAIGPIVKLKTAGTIAYGDYVGPTTAGEIIKVTVDATHQQIVGFALQAAVDNDVIQVLLTGGIISNAT